jgi:hypothetical protein
MEDKHPVAIPPEILAQAQGYIGQAIGVLLPYIIALTPIERRSMLKMGEKTLSFVEKAHEYALQYPQFCPPFLDTKEFTTDFDDARGMIFIHSQALRLYEGIDDTQMLAGSEAFHAALVFYNSVKQAAAQNIPGAKSLYEELRKRFPGTKRKPSGDEE